MIIKSTEFQNNIGKYMDLAAGEEIVVTKNGRPFVRIIGENTAISFLSDKLVGLLPKGIDEGNEKDERLGKQ